MLRKCVVIVVVTLLAPFVGFGSDFGLGIKLGAGYPFFSGQDYQDVLDAATILSGVDAYGADFSTRFKVGFSGGAYATLGLFNFVAVQPEAIFTMGGGAVGYSENYYLYSYREDYNVWMVELPVLLKIRFGYRKEGNNKPSKYIMAGPGMAFLLGDGKVKTKLDGEKLTNEELSDDFFGDNYAFVVFGAGLEGFKDNFLSCVEVRYHMGLTSVLDESLGLDDYKENNVQLLMGFKFRSKQKEKPPG